jgi:adenylate cyclase 8
VNAVDLVLKCVLAGVCLLGESKMKEEELITAILWSIFCGLANLAICLLGLWRCFANNYLHWAAIVTWLLLNLQGIDKVVIFILSY